MAEYSKIPLAFDALNIEKKIIDALNPNFKRSWAAKSANTDELPIRTIEIQFEKRDDLVLDGDVTRQTYIGLGDIHLIVKVRDLKIENNEDLAILAYINTFDILNTIPVREILEKFLSFFGLNMVMDFPRTLLTFKSDNGLVNKTVPMEDLPIDEEEQTSLYDFFITCKEEWVKEERL